MPRRRRARQPLGRYGYPGPEVLVRQASRLAGASVPSRRATVRPYEEASADVGGFTRALVSLLRADRGAAAEAYDPSIARLEAANEAARGRLGALGPEYAIPADAAGGSGLQALLEGRAQAGAYGAKMPGIAASRGALAQTGIVNARNEALRQRDEAMRQAFVQLYDQVQTRALALAQANYGIFNDERAFREQRRQFDAEQRRMAAAEAGGAGYTPKQRNEAFFSARSDMLDDAEELFKGKQVEAGLSGYRTVRPSYRQAYSKLWRRYGPELVNLYGLDRGRVRGAIRQALINAGYNPPKRRGGRGRYGGISQGPH